MTGEMLDQVDRGKRDEGNGMMNRVKGKGDCLPLQLYYWIMYGVDNRNAEQD